MAKKSRSGRIIAGKRKPAKNHCSGKCYTNDETADKSLMGTLGSMTSAI